MTEKPAKPARKSLARSRVTNGNKLGAGMDGRLVWARRLRDLIDAYTSDLGEAEDLSQMKRSLIRRAATLTVELERAEASFAEAGKADEAALSAYQTTANSLRRILESIGLKTTSVKEASDLARVIEGGRVIKEAVDKFSLADHAVCVGNSRAKYDLARRIAFAVRRAKETGEPIDPRLAAFAVDLAMATYGDEDGNVAVPEDPPAPANDRGIL